MNPHNTPLDGQQKGDKDPRTGQSRKKQGPGQPSREGGQHDRARADERSSRDTMRPVDEEGIGEMHEPEVEGVGNEGRDQTDTKRNPDR